MSRKEILVGLTLFAVASLTVAIPGVRVAEAKPAACPDSECDIGNKCRYHMGTYCKFDVLMGGIPGPCEDRNCGVS